GRQRGRGPLRGGVGFPLRTRGPALPPSLVGFWALSAWGRRRPSCARPLRRQHPAERVALPRPRHPPPLRGPSPAVPSLEREVDVTVGGGAGFRAPRLPESHRRLRR